MTKNSKNNAGEHNASPMRRAILSVADKSGLERLALFLRENQIELIATGGTLKFLREREIPAISVSAVTGQPEILGGRVKSLHPKIHGGILFRRGESDDQVQITEAGIKPIDLVVINLYPFERVTADPACSLEDAIENIDIGGPAMIRAAAKNAAAVAVLTDPADYDEFIDKFRQGDGVIDIGTRREWAARAFARTAVYDAAIAAYLERHTGGEKTAEIPSLRISGFRKVRSLRYGENPHQQGALYKKIERAGGGGGRGHQLSLTDAEVLSGKELSYNNYVDLECALACLADSWSKPFAMVIKHATPCGAAQADSLAAAYQLAYDTDPLSAYGSIIGLNRIVDLETAEKLAKTFFVECVLAPGYEDDAWLLLKKKKARRFLSLPGIENPPSAAEWVYRALAGGLLAQSPDTGDILANELKVVTKKAPTKAQVSSLLFGRRLVKHVRSNAIVLVQGEGAVGIGGGQTSRIDAVKMAIEKAGERAGGAVLASDAFFPMPDNIETAAQAGITAIIQPGGSKKDPEVIAAADELGVAMVFSGMRNFRH